MEYINGPTLNEYIKQHQPLDINTVINFTEQIINGIEHAHEHRIVHRDVKPQNVLVCEDYTLKVLDFGIAKALSETTMTHTNSVLGTVQYLSPEQARGENTDKTTDVYSIGIVLYELLMGNRRSKVKRRLVSRFNIFNPLFPTFQKRVRMYPKH